MNNNLKVLPLGGNQYNVEHPHLGEGMIIDLDGVELISEEDYLTLANAGINMDKFLTPSDDAGDIYWRAAAEYAVNYSGFNAVQYLKDNQ